MSNRENERAKANTVKVGEDADFIYVRVPFGFEIAEPKPWKGGAP